MGVSDIQCKPTNSLFQPHYNKERNSKYRYKIMLTDLPTVKAEPAVNAVTQHEHRNYR
jgi:hypothetical protein